MNKNSLVHPSSFIPPPLTRGGLAIMSIKFICSCGKHLRARDEMAARRSMCPRCGRPVGVPSMRPTHAGTSAAPLTPQERIRLNRNKLDCGIYEPEVPTTKIYPSLTQPARPPSSLDNPPPSPKVYRRRRQLEQHWYQCLTYSFLNWKSLFCFALMLSVGMAGIVLTVQNFPSFSLSSLQNWLPWASSVLFVVLIVAFAYAKVECALTSALAGKGPGCYWPGWSTADPLKSSVRWLVCFFAGPIVPAGLAAYFWIYGGDLTGWDWAIVAELGVLAAAYWLLAIVSANERNRLRDANPLRIAQLLQRLKYRAVVPVLIAPAFAFAHALVAFFALTSLHPSPAFGWLLLMVCWGSVLFWSAFLFRLLGVWCYYAKPIEPIKSLRA
jgi:hypothetical protein